MRRWPGAVEGPLRLSRWWGGTWPGPSGRSRGNAGALRYRDRIGIGRYRIDLHPCTGGDNCIGVPSCPFHIPLGALLPRRMKNLLAGSRNTGTTHITNGRYRLHPVQWNAGAGANMPAAHA